MTWLLISALCCLAGALRYFDGAGAGENRTAASIPSFVFSALIGITTGFTAWVASSNLSASAVAAVNAGICVHYGGTEWKSLKHQFHRGIVYALPLIIYLYASGTPFAWGNVLGICGCFTAAYVVYYGVDEIKPPVGHWEQWCRCFQGWFICASGIFV